TGDFNVGSINTGWFNTGDSNTGIANSGNVNTGALISGDYSNGILWRGEYQGLLNLYYELDVPPTSILDAHFAGSFGPVVIPDIPVPAVNLHLAGSIALGSFSIPEIAIPAINPDITGSVAIGPISIPSVTIPSVNFADILISMDPSTGSLLEIEPFIMWTAAGAGPLGPTYYSFGSSYAFTHRFAVGSITMGGGTTGEFGMLIRAISKAFNTPALNISQLALGIEVLGGTNALTLFPGGLTFDGASLSLAVTGGGGGVDIPAIVFPQIPASATGSLYVIPSSIPLLNVPASPGFGNTTTSPSSGFFNSGAGGGSGWGNFGAGMSGWWN
ncbi:pentapeptide repeat-containing protein, partial [Mycobacterium bourgelatii]